MLKIKLFLWLCLSAFDLFALDVERLNRLNALFFYDQPYAVFKVATTTSISGRDVSFEAVVLKKGRQFAIVYLSGSFTNVVLWFDELGMMHIYSPSGQKIAFMQQQQDIINMMGSFLFLNIKRDYALADGLLSAKSDTSLYKTIAIRSNKNGIPVEVDLFGQSKKLATIKPTWEDKVFKFKVFFNDMPTLRYELGISNFKALDSLPARLFSSDGLPLVKIFASSLGEVYQ